MRILVTNDDGVDSTPLPMLAKRMADFGDVVVAAPDQEYSGFGAALGTLHTLRPEIRRIDLPGVAEAWAVTGPPALCVMFARLGAFGPPFDLVVSGVNPGANVGRAVYHSGTVGAALTARNGGISGIAISQAVAGFGVEGQGWDEMLDHMVWETGVEVAGAFVGAFVDDVPAEPVVVNLNAPNLPIDEVAGWKRCDVGVVPPRTLVSARVVPKPGHDRAFHVEMDWGEPTELPDDVDGGVIEAGYVAVTYLTRLADRPDLDLPGPEAALDALLP